MKAEGVVFAVGNGRRRLYPARRLCDMPGIVVTWAHVDHARTHGHAARVKRVRAIVVLFRAVVTIVCIAGVR